MMNVKHLLLQPKKYLSDVQEKKNDSNCVKIDYFVCFLKKKA